MTPNINECSGNAVFTLEIKSPSQICQFIMRLLPESNGNTGADFYRQSAQQALHVIVSAFHLLDKPYTSKELSEVLLHEEKLLKLKEKLKANHGDSTEHKDFENLLGRYTTTSGFNMEKFKETLGGLAGRLYSISQQTI